MSSPRRADELLPIGQIARRAGLTAPTLRFYEDEGLIASSRSPGGRRQYPRSVLRRLAFIRAARSVGLTLGEIRQTLATFPAGRTPTQGDWARLSTAWRPRIDEQIEALRTGLDGCIGCGCLSIERCPLANPDDRAAGSGAGARYLPERPREKGREKGPAQG
jgi:MerR family redox-sensitive transcriptional activator SoxR